MEYPDAKIGILGFFMVFNRQIQAFEYSSDALFDPHTVNVGQEVRLWQRMKEKGVWPRINTHCFAHHYKGTTIGQSPHKGEKETRDDLEAIHARNHAEVSSDK